MELRIIIIDDEADAVDAIRNILEINDNYRVIGHTTDPVNGLALILQHKPDVVFLDIEMPGINGFQLLESISNIDFDVIFATAYERYAIQAIKANALDYILKPVSISDVLNALEKVKTKRSKEINFESNYKNLLADLNLPQKTRIQIPTTKGLEFIELDDVVYLEADGAYTTAYLKNTEKVIISKSIKFIEPLLNKNYFFRVHRSYTVNTNYLRRLDRENKTLILKDQTEIPFSRRRYDDLMDFLDKMEK
ncbi:MAG: LytTR family DNA-binding domain-containing protein [Bacteroidetes bacterium]|nr:LytTR family DNA-binding domain-containing protein [Bacteroidota bacterium]